MQWYTIHTKPHQEQVAETHLRRFGIETLYPRLKRRKVIRRKSQVVIGPLFPSYLFARLDLGTQYRVVTYTRGVRRVVAFGLVPAIVPDDVIEGIREKLQDGHAGMPIRSYKPGQLVHMEQGPFQGLEMVFEREMSDRQRVVLLLRALAYQVRVVVPYDQLMDA